MDMSIERESIWLALAAVSWVDGGRDSDAVGKEIGDGSEAVGMMYSAGAAVAAGSGVAGSSDGAGAFRCDESQLTWIDICNANRVNAIIAFVIMK